MQVSAGPTCREVSPPAGRVVDPTSRSARANGSDATSGPTLPLNIEIPRQLDLSKDRTALIALRPDHRGLFFICNGAWFSIGDWVRMRPEAW